MSQRAGHIFEALDEAGRLLVVGATGGAAIGSLTGHMGTIVGALAGSALCLLCGLRMARQRTQARA
jgi:uncharacterized membrane protein YdjX (TVP38/TMEM64 family)